MFNFSKLFVSILGIGFVPLAPGSVGSLFSIFIVYLINPYLLFSYKILLFTMILILSLITIKIYSEKISRNDTKEIVIDEFLGIFFIFIFFEYFKFANDFIMILLIFIFFRFFDIIKFFPANWIDKNIKNSYGVIFDDLVAGFYSLIVLFTIDGFL